MATLRPPKLRPSVLFIAFAGVCVLAFLIYQIPAVNDRLSWRLDFAYAYMRGVINPVEPLPTPKVIQAAILPDATPTPSYQSSPTPTQTAAVTLQPSPTPTITLTPTAIPGEAELPAPPFTKQDINNCGPATLTMYLQFYGWEGAQIDIANEVKPIREDRNVNVEELTQFVRSKVGWLNIEYRVGGNTDLIRKFLAEGIPVMIEETFMMADSYWPNDDRWAGHYLLITGYRDSPGIFTTQDSFVGPNQHVSYHDLEHNWQSFNHVYILVYRPEQAPTVQAILGDNWDRDKNRQYALDQAKIATQKDPLNAFDWFNLGSNQVYFDRYSEAAASYDQARKLGLPQRMLRYQFGPFMAYFHTQRNDDLMTLTEYALKITPNSEEAMLWRGWGQYRAGKKDDAINLFKQALGVHPGYPDALYAIDFVNKN